MSSDSPQKTATKNPRLRALEPFIDGLRTRWRSSSDPMEVPEIKIGSRTVEMSSWEWSQVGISAERGLVDDNSVAWLVAQGVALQVKIYKDLEKLEAVEESSNGPAYAVRGELMLDTAVGRSLVRKLQDASNQLLRGGGMKDVQELTPFSHRIRNLTFEVRSMLQHDEKDQADALVKALDGDEDAGEASSTVRKAASSGAETKVEARAIDKGDANQAQQRRTPESAKRKRSKPARSTHPAAEQRSWKRTAFLAAALTIALVVRFGVLEHLNGSPDTIDRDRLGRLGSISQVEDRWPSLFVTVDGDAWYRFSEDDRVKAVTSASTALANLNYEGMWVRTDRGDPAARWLRLSGVVLVTSEIENTRFDDVSETSDN